MSRAHEASTIFNANFQIGMAAPLDNRDVVEYYADLADSIGLNKYTGELVYVLNDTIDNGAITYAKGFYLYNGTAWVKFESGGGGSPVLSQAMSIKKPLGGIDASTSVPVNYPIGTSIETILRDLLLQVITPTYESPSASMTQYGTTLYKVGSSVAAKTITLTYNAGAIYLDGVKQNNRGGAATSYSLSTSGATTDYNSSNSSGTFSVSALTRSTKGNIVVTGTIEYAAGAQPKDSNGDNYETALSAGSVNTTQTLEFILPFYHGVSSSSSVSSLSGLTESVAKKGNRTCTFNQSNQYAVFAYDKAYGNLSKIIENSTTYNVLSGWTKSTLGDYYVYVQNSPHTDSSASFTFQF